MEKVHIVIENRIPEDGEQYQRIHGVFIDKDKAQQHIKECLLEYIDENELDELPDGGDPNSGGSNWNALARRNTMQMNIEQLKAIVENSSGLIWTKPRWSIQTMDVT